MTVTEKIKKINNKINQNKAHYNLETANISALSLGNARKYEFLTREDILPEKKTVRTSCYNQKILNIHH